MAAALGRDIEGYMFAYLKQNSKTFSDNSFEKFASIYDEISLSKSDSTSSSSVSESETKLLF